MKNHKKNHRFVPITKCQGFKTQEPPIEETKVHTGSNIATYKPKTEINQSSDTIDQDTKLQPRNKSRIHAVCFRKSKKFNCLFCDKKFYSERSLRCHIDFMHESENVKRYKCRKCLRSFNEQRNRQKHFKMEHDTIIKLVTDRKDTLETQQAEKQHNNLFVSTSSKSLQAINHRQLASHKHESPDKFNCSLCPKMFNCSWSLLSHEDKEHQLNKVKRYRCLNCARSFNWKINLKKHKC